MSDDGPLERLLTLQDQDTALDQLRHRRDHLPERAALADHEAAVAALAAERAEVDGRRAERARDLRRLQDEVAGIEARVAELGRSMSAITAPRELQALQHEEQSLRRRQDHLETEELEIMEALDPLDAALTDLDARTAALDADGERLTAGLREAEVAVEEELTTVLAAREAAVAEVPADLLATYDRLRERLGGVAVARLVGGVCGGCHLGMSAVEVDRIRREPPDAIVHCDECGRLLVR